MQKELKPDVTNPKTPSKNVPLQEEKKAALRLCIRLGIGLFVLFVLVFLLPTLWNVLSPFIVAFIVAASLQPFIKMAITKLKMKKGFAVTLSIVFICLIALLILYWFVSFAVGQIISAVNNMPEIITSVIKTLELLTNKLFASLDHVPESVEQWIRTSLSEGFTWMYNFAVTQATSILSGTINFAASLPQILIYTNFLVLALCFMTSGYENMRKYFPGNDRNSLIGKLRTSAGAGLGGYLKVQIIYTVFVLIVSWLYLQIFGFQYSVLIAMLAALLELLPLFGNGTLYIPWIIICFIIGETKTAILVLILHLFLYIVRKVTEPRLMSNKMGLSPLSSLFFMYAGMKLYGVLGLTFAPVLGVVLTNAWHSGLFVPMIEDYRTVIHAVKKATGYHVAGVEKEHVDHSNALK